MLDDSMTTGRVEPASVAENEDHTLAATDDGGETRDENMDLRKRFVVGDRFAGFQIRGVLGRGAMGVVYEAWDATLERRVALKLLRSPSKRAAERLLREARALARLDHPGVVRIWGAEVHRGALYIAMELVEGQSMREWMRVERTWREVLPVFIGAGRGLTAAHVAGVIHRDFKPENVLVGWDGQARVLDFGIARISGGQSDATTTGDGHSNDGEGSCSSAPLSGSFAGLGLSTDEPLTEVGSLIGTLRYMAPEQHERLPADELSDQFAFCVTLFEAVYGRHPFPARTREQLAYKVFEKLVEFPEENARSAPRWLKRALLRGLSPDPKDRFPSMEGLLDALTRHPARRRRRAQRAAAATLVIGAVAAGFALPARAVPSPCADVAAEARAALGADARAQLRARFEALGQPWAKALGAEAEETLGVWVGDWVEARTEVCEIRHAHGGSETPLDLGRAACLEEQLDQVQGLGTVLREADAPTLVEAEHLLVALPDPDRCLGDDPAQVAQSREVQGEEARELLSELDELRWLAQAVGTPGLRERTGALVDGARDLDSAPSTQALLAEALIVDGEVDALFGEGEEARAQLREAGRIAERIGADGLRVWAKIDLGYVLATTPGGAREAVDTLEDAAALVQRVGTPWHRHLRQRSSLAAAHLRLQEFERAEAILEELEEEFEAGAARRGAQAHAQVLVVRASVAFESGDHQGAVRHAKRALALIERELGAEHPLAASPLGSLGLAQGQLGRNDEAREALERAVSLRRGQVARGSGGAERRLALDLIGLGNLESRLGRGEVASKHYREVLGLLADSEAQADVAARALITFDLGVDHQISGREREALNSYREAEKLSGASNGPRHGLSVAARMGTGSMLVALGRFSEARAPLESALADWPESLRGTLDEAELRFALAQTLASLDGPSARTASLAEDARAAYAKAGVEAEAARVGAWLATVD